jgi:hypothetical protein
VSSLSTEQAFAAMRLFLERHFKRTGSDDIGSLLGDLQQSEDGKPFDPAAWNDWLDSVKQVLNNTTNP